MQKFSAIFIAILLTLNIVSSLRLNPIDASILPSNSIRTQLTQILQEVQQTENPKTIKQFLEQVKTMATKLQEEQDKHKEISEKMMAQCNEEDNFRKTEVETAQNALNKSVEAKSKCDASLNSATKDLPELKSALQTYTNELEAATKQREAEHATYLQRKADYTEAIAYLKDFNEYVEKSLPKMRGTTTAFVQKSEQILRHATRLGMLKEAVPVLVAIASHQNLPANEVPAEQTNFNFSAQTDLAQKLRDAIQSLLNRLNADFTDNEDQENRSVQAFASLREKLQGAINLLTENIAKTEKQITDMTLCSQEEAVVINSATAKLERNRNLRESASKMCGSFALEFTNATQNRKEEIETITQILQIIEKRFGKIPEDLKLYLDNVVNGWKEYINSTPFKVFEEYQKNHKEVHQAGKALVDASNLLPVF